MTDKNPLDDVIKELNIRLLHPMAEADYNQGVLDAIRIIESHRPALEAGMRGTLRFYQTCKDSLNYKLRYDYPNNTGTGVVTVGGKDYCIALAQSLGLTAEFVDGESDE